MAYERCAATGKLDEMRTAFVPPVDFALERTSGWANFFLGRDHAKKKKGAAGQ
jgi:hypothetical protein